MNRTEELATSEFPDIPSEFQRRKRIAEQLKAPWTALMIVGWLPAFVVFSFFDSLSPVVVAGSFLFSLVMLGGSIIRINFINMKHYRCPACGEMPIVFGTRGGLLLDPRECPRCGVSFNYYNRY